ncbi:MAG: nucleoside triphosphate pyrophosphohydrolase [Gemmatimonadetes bacterium]|nr:nucleoside triphosphate pyrophosphohydrolase [Gemmatimonadota bacterium]
MNEPQADPVNYNTPPGVLDRALALVEFLRAGCAWDAAQTPSSLRRYLLEESHEVVDAIECGDEVELRDELGDLLLNVAFQVVLAEERSAFDRHAVVAGLESKMRRRHPHLYGDGEAESWEAYKARERGEPAATTPGVGLLGDIHAGGDALAHAQRIQERVATVGFDWADPRGAWEKVREETEEVGEELAHGDRARLEEELGDLLFSIVNLTRLCGVHAPTALSRANRKFSRRFAALEALAARRGVDLPSAGLEKLDLFWNEAKREGG